MYEMVTHPGIDPYLIASSDVITYAIGPCSFVQLNQILLVIEVLVHRQLVECMLIQTMFFCFNSVGDLCYRETTSDLFVQDE